MSLNDSLSEAGLLSRRVKLGFFKEDGTAEHTEDTLHDGVRLVGENIPMKHTTTAPAVASGSLFDQVSCTERGVG